MKQDKWVKRKTVSKQLGNDQLNKVISKTDDKTESTFSQLQKDKSPQNSQKRNFSQDDKLTDSSQKTSSQLTKKNEKANSSTTISAKKSDVTKPKKSNLIITTSRIKISPPKKKKPTGPATTHYSYFHHDTSAKNPGVKFVPPGTGECFAKGEFSNKNFVITGIFDELERDEMKDLIQRFGGKTTTGISGKTIRIIAGDDAGPKKIETAKEKNITVWTEDDLLDYIIKEENIIVPKVIPKRQMSTQQSQSTQNTQNLTNTFISNEPIWTEKYRPQRKSDIVGNSSQVSKLFRWFSLWKNSIPDRRGVLLAGPPGIGKTTVAKIVGRTHNFNPIEYNASDTRNKKSVSEAIKNVIYNGQFGGKQALIIMDEVDGMSAGDRGGIAELVSLIKKSERPIVCICNDVLNKKMSSLVNCCETINFNKVSPRDIQNRLKIICENEEKDISDETIEQISERSFGDVRYAVNMLQTYASSSLLIGNKESQDKNYIEIVPTLISQYNKTDWAQKLNVFHLDNFMVPIYLHDSLLRKQSYKNLSKTWNAFAHGDVYRQILQTTQNWKLLPVVGMYSIVLTTYYGRTTNPASMVMFPMTLSKISKRKGNETRLLNITNTLPDRLLPSRTFASEEMMFIRNTIMKLMVNDPLRAAQIAKSFGLDKEKWDDMVKVGEGLEKKPLYGTIKTANKTRFTKYLKEVNPVEGFTKKKTTTKGKKSSQYIDEEEDLETQNADIISEEDSFIDDEPDYYDGF